MLKVASIEAALSYYNNYPFKIIHSLTASQSSQLKEPTKAI